MTHPSDIAGLSERLHHAITTASNDDCSKPGTVDRARHAARVDAMQEAATAFDTLTAENARLTKRLDLLAAGFGVPDGGKYLEDWQTRIKQYQSLTARVKELGAERAAEWNRRRDVESQRDVLKAAIGTLRQERDEAVKALAETRGDWHTDGWDRARNSGRILLVWREFAGVREHVELGRYSDSKAAWVNTYGHSFHADPDGWAPLLPFKTAEAIRSEERDGAYERAAMCVETFEISRRGLPVLKALATAIRRLASGQGDVTLSTSADTERE